jgi:hypothetical protein
VFLIRAPFVLLAARKPFVVMKLANAAGAARFVPGSAAHAGAYHTS